MHGNQKNCHGSVPARQDLRCFFIVSEKGPELYVDIATFANSCLKQQCEHVGGIEVTFNFLWGQRVRQDQVDVIRHCKIGRSKQKGVDRSFQLVSVLEKCQRKNEKTLWRQVNITHSGYRVQRVMEHLVLTGTINQFFRKQSMLRF